MINVFFFKKIIYLPDRICKFTTNVIMRNVHNNKWICIYIQIGELMVNHSYHTGSKRKYRKWDCVTRPSYVSLNKVIYYIFSIWLAVEFRTFISYRLRLVSWVRLLNLCPCSYRDSSFVSFTLNTNMLLTELLTLSSHYTNMCLTGIEVC